MSLSKDLVGQEHRTVRESLVNPFDLVFPKKIVERL